MAQQSSLSASVSIQLFEHLHTQYTQQLNVVTHSVCGRDAARFIWDPSELPFIHHKVGRGCSKDIVRILFISLCRSTLSRESVLSDILEGKTVFS